GEGEVGGRGGDGGGGPRGGGGGAAGPRGGGGREGPAVRRPPPIKSPWLRVFPRKGRDGATCDATRRFRPRFGGRPGSSGTDRASAQAAAGTSDVQWGQRRARRGMLVAQRGHSRVTGGAAGARPAPPLAPPPHPAH